MKSRVSFKLSEKFQLEKLDPPLVLLNAYFAILNCVCIMHAKPYTIVRYTLYPCTGSSTVGL